MSASPPALPLLRWRSLGPGELDHELIWLSVSVGALVCGGAWLGAGLPLPLCAFKAVTGCPCAGCGSTRAVLQLLQGHFGKAFRFNPLAMLAAAGWALFCGYALAVLALRTPRLRPRAISPALGRATRVAVVTAIALNWAWVIWRGN